MVSAFVSKLHKDSCDGVPWLVRSRSPQSVQGLAAPASLDMASRSAETTGRWTGASLVRTCPSVMKLTYFRGDSEHEVFISFHWGKSIVGLRIAKPWGQQWSGWHGSWSHTELGGLVVYMHYTGRATKARKHHFRLVGHRVYEFWQWQDIHIRATAEMVTLLLMPAQLADVAHEDADWTAV
jgi:hypothetical protein